MVNAYIGPAVQRYVARLGEALGARAIERFMVVKSNGGLTSPENAARYPVHLIESGPAAAIIATAEARWKAHGLPPAKFGHREKFGNDPEKHKDFSAVTHVAKDKGIPPFLILHVAEHPDTSAQARRLANVLKEAGVPVTVFGGRETTHNKLNADLGLPDDPATKALYEFLDGVLKK